MRLNKPLTLSVLHQELNFLLIFFEKLDVKLTVKGKRGLKTPVCHIRSLLGNSRKFQEIELSLKLFVCLIQLKNVVIFFPKCWWLIGRNGSL